MIEKVERERLEKVHDTETGLSDPVVPSAKAEKADLLRLRS